MNQVCQHIVDLIRTRPQGKISFVEYMNCALYHPQYGYYASRPALIGAKGDFVTAPHLAADFGELLAVQLEQMWQILGQPSPFTVVEMGAGQGLIIQDVCRFLQRHCPACFQALAYRVIEKSEALMNAQRYQMRHLLKDGGVPGQGLDWCTWAEIDDHSIVGCLVSNELVDAFPVHLVQWQGDRLYERYVTLADAPAPKPEPKPEPKPRLKPELKPEPRPSIVPAVTFQTVLGELSTDALNDYFSLVDIHFGDGRFEAGYRSEVNLAALDWLATVATKLQRGYVLTIDYGYPASRYYSPARRDGTLQCYYQHAHHSNPYIHVGEQDITTHVDFTALERQGTRCGLQSVGFAPQGLFLMALGLGDRLSSLSQLVPNEAVSINDILRRRDALHALINPIGMGNFGVLVQSKGLSPIEQATPLKGLNIPPMN